VRSGLAVLVLRLLGDVCSVMFDLLQDTNAQERDFGTHKIAVLTKSTTTRF
jgi:hypothetical protein